MSKETLSTSETEKTEAPKIKLALQEKYEEEKYKEEKHEKVKHEKEKHEEEKFAVCKRY